MERLLRSVLTISPRAACRVVINYTGLFCACAWTWEHLITIQSAEGPSMYPTFSPKGDWVLISRRYANGKNIQVGDVVRYHHPNILGGHAAKRVLGMPGDFVCVDPPYSTGAGTQPDMIQVPEGHVFLVGDNLPWSRDSRNFGALPLGLINGKVIARVWPPSKIEWVRNTMQPADLD